MKTRYALTHEDARRMAAACEAEATRNGWAVVFSIVDDGGHPLWLQRLDGAPPLSAHMCMAKAQTAAMGRRETKVYEDMINQGRTAFVTAPIVHGMLEGAVPIMVEGVCLGAIGVSGVKSIEDAQVAKAGVAALGAPG
jgi:glc operon protein GlcG